MTAAEHIALVAVFALVFIVSWALVYTNDKLKERIREFERINDAYHRRLRDLEQDQDRADQKVSGLHTWTQERINALEDRVYHPAKRRPWWRLWK